MNEQDKKLLELYLKDERKKKILFIIIAIIFIAVFLFYGYYSKVKQSANEIDNSIQEETQNNIINEISANEENTLSTENKTTKEDTKNENQVNEVAETHTEEKQETTQEESKKQETQEKNTDNAKTTASSESKEKKTNEKPANKDFLFTEGYTMDNVTQAAQDYLQSFSYSGECVPIKDNEGVCLGMRVTFY